MQDNAKPWYTHSFVWLLIALPATAVIASGLLIYQAASTADGLVADDYYKAGQEINKDLHRDEAATKLGINAQLMLSADGKHIRVLFTAPPPGQQLQLKLLHPTRSGLDHVLPLTAQGGQIWQASIDRPLESARWKIELSDQGKNWRLTGNWRADAIEPAQLGTTASAVSH
ncbi:FixH family protein [Chitinilyticum piscinae]|uniref:FixH family protein n=1 Tax=Chitinilyticum piscinae TaxID=2866724 RepID=A0A8J7K8M3_9NEIS|nr:FixH family protein [Chitinilyticum piscinae]MBE9609703.1 FixH family protein [Chitinilyticum piscinae]